jgi:fatty acid desaturase
MDAILIDEPLVSRERLRELQTRRNGPSVRRLLAQSLLYFGSAAGLLYLCGSAHTSAVLPLGDQRIAIAALVLLSGVTQFAMFGMLHEACHRTVFVRPWANDLAGWIAALAQPMSPALMRAFHFEHHRHTHQLPRDPELGGLEFMAQWPRGLMWPVTMTGVSLLVARVGWSLFAALMPARANAAWVRVLPFVTPERRRQVAWEARVLMAIHAGAIVLASTIVPALWWVYVGMMLGHMFLSWYVTCEHRGLAQAGTVLERTRSLITPSWLRWLVWNMPYHAEHHAWPAVPWHALPDLHVEVRPHLVHRERPLWLHLHGGRERPQTDERP